MIIIIIILVAIIGYCSYSRDNNKHYFKKGDVSSKTVNKDNSSSLQSSQNQTMNNEMNQSDIPNDPSTAKGLTKITPSFDCGNASSASERLICSDEELAQADIQLEELYESALKKAPDKSALQREQTYWVVNVRDACTDVNSMLKSYKDRITELSQ